MRKVKVKYESHIFQEGNIDKFEEETFGELLIKDEEVNITCLLNASEGKEKTEFIFKNDSVSIIKKSYILNFELNKKIDCVNSTQYGNIILTTKLKKYLKLINQYVINYELLIGDDSIGSYVVKISYEEMK